MTIKEDTVFIYDRTWEGMLTAVFDAFFRKTFPVAMLHEREMPPMFAEVYHVVTDEEKAGSWFFVLCRKNSLLRQ